MAVFKGRPGTVLKISAMMVAVNIAGSLMLMGPFGHVGLAIATAVSGLLAAVIMVVLLSVAGKISGVIVLQLIRIFLAASFMAVMLWCISPLVTDMSALGRLLILVAAGGGTYFIAAVLLGAVPVGLLRRR